MNAQKWAAIISGLLPFFPGLYLTLVGHRIIGKKRDPNKVTDLDQEKKMENYKKWGPPLMIVGLFLALLGLFR